MSRTREKESRWCVIPLLCVAAVLGGCGGVQIKPELNLPTPLVQPLAAKVGLVITPELSNYVHKETRWGVSWEASLGSGHQKLFQSIFEAAFRDYQTFGSLEEARAASDLKAIFVPGIEQYSFVTARETGGQYYAVTIRYRINLYTPEGDLADSYTLTGYGNALAKGISSGRPLEQASLAAMRDAAAKFLVQFPDQPTGQRLARNEAVVAEPAMASDAGGEIEAVPIHEPKEEPGQSAAQPPSPAAVPASPSTPSGAP